MGPLVYLGSKLFGLSDVFIGRLITDVSAGIIEIIFTRKMFKNQKN